MPDSLTLLPLLTQAPAPVLYTPSLTEYIRRKTVTATIGDVPMGSDYPIRVQSMTTIDTMDTAGSVAQRDRKSVV